MYSTSLTDLLNTVREQIKSHIEDFEPNATYKKAPELKDYLDLNVVKAVVHAMASGQRYYLVGDAGIGKTSFIKWICSLLGYRCVYIPAAQISIENLMVPFPKDDPEFGRKVLETMFFKDLISTGEPIVIFIDEVGRADASLGNTLMELLQEGSLAGRPIENLVTVIAADNPAGAAYGKLGQLDFSQADRLASVVLTSKDTPWRRAMAEEHKDVDLNKVFSLYDTLPAKIREIFNPRLMSGAIHAVLEGFPAVYTLPMVNGKRLELKDDSGKDRTKEILDKFCAALGTVNREKVPNVIAKAVKYSVTHGKNIYIQGRPGVGKTSYIKGLLADLGVNAHYDSAAVLQPEDMNVPFPSSDWTTLELMPMRKFADPKPWVWVLDEINRADKRTKNAFMEPIQERTLGGQRTALISTIALNNPREIAGMKLDVGTNDLAQATRFTLSLDIDAGDIPSTGFLLDKYGEEVAAPFVEWWQDDLDDLGRVLCTPRTLERLIGIYEAGNPLQWGLAYVNGAYVKVALVELQARLDKRPMARLRQIVANVDEYERQLLEGKDENPMEHATVFMAFYKAELKQLDDVKPVCARLFAALDKQHRIDLVRQGGDRQKFWNQILLAEKKKTK